jgi:hypothetical protein
LAGALSFNSSLEFAFRYHSDKIDRLFQEGSACMEHLPQFSQFILTRTGLALVTLLLVSGVVACGGGGSSSSSEGDAVDEDGVRLTTRSEASYKIDDLVSVGFKKNRQFPTDTVPGTTDIWYGFFSQRDIEVRFYDSHADAIAMGTGPAETIIARTAGQRDPLIPVVNLYPAYAIVGNMVMLCERQISTCQALIDVLP